MRQPIRILGDPILNQRCHPIQDVSLPDVLEVAQQLKGSLYHLRAELGFGRGIAAPQIGYPIRMVFTHITEDLILINPRINCRSAERFHLWDDCLSVPDLLVRVSRHRWIDVTYQDLEGNTRSLRAEDDFSELLQHELDHLDGLLMIYRGIGANAICHVDELKRQAKTGVCPPLPIYLRGVQ